MIQRDNLTGRTYNPADTDDLIDHTWLGIKDAYDHEPPPPLICAKAPKPRPLPEDAADHEENSNAALRQYMQRVADTDDILTAAITAGKWAPITIDRY